MTKNGNVKTGIDDWHVYSVVWDAENIKIYCDGKCYFKCTAGEWYSGSDRGNTYAPFDQRFYLILNLAAGGTFDSGYVPDDNFTSTMMEVDYVRVYQRKVASNENEQNDKNANVKTDGANDGLYGDYKLGTKIITNPTTEPTTPAPTETTPESTKAPEKTTKPQVTTPIVKKTVGKTKVKKATKKIKAKKISILLKKAKNAKKYQVQVSKNKKFKKILVKKTVKKTKFTIKSKKLKNKKKLYVRARAVGCKTWSKPKK